MKIQARLFAYITIALLSACATPQPPAGYWPLPAAVVESPPVDWAEQTPNSREISAVYPERALRMEKTGMVYLSCLILADRHLECVVRSETPPDFGFGEAALRLVHLFVVQREEKMSVLKIGKRITVPVRFAL